MRWQTSTLERYVYVIQMGEDGPVKIGISWDPRFRANDLQVGNPYQLRIVTSFSGGLELEQELHRKLAAHRMKGEWFHPHPEVFAAIKVEVERYGRTSPKHVSGLWQYERCANCDTLLHDAQGSTVRMRRDDEAPRFLCNPCDEMAAMRAQGIDPFADDAE